MQTETATIGTDLTPGEENLFVFMSKTNSICIGISGL